MGSKSLHFIQQFSNECPSNCSSSETHNHYFECNNGKIQTIRETSMRTLCLQLVQMDTHPLLILTQLSIIREGPERTFLNIDKQNDPIIKKNLKCNWRKHTFEPILVGERFCKQRVGSSTDAMESDTRTKAKVQAEELEQRFDNKHSKLHKWNNMESKEWSTTWSK